MKKDKKLYLFKIIRPEIYAGIFIVSFFLSSATLFSQQKEVPPNIKPVLKQAGLFEDIKDGVPINQGLVFSSSLGKVICFTDFDPVPEKTFIYHKFYFKDKLSSRVKLTLNPPRWATFSRIQLRETDIGPWRVEITDEAGKVLHVIRFSITD
jgi:hypothetical protein